MTGTFIRTANHEIVLVAEHSEGLLDRGHLLGYLIGRPPIDCLTQNPANQFGT
jgi:hypothetical protein